METWNMEMATGQDGTGQGLKLPGLVPRASRQCVLEVVTQIHPIAVQYPLRIEFDEVPWALVGKIDLLATLADGSGEVVWDTKATAGSTKYDPGEDLQLGIYALGREFEGKAPALVGVQLARI